MRQTTTEEFLRAARARGNPEEDGVQNRWKGATMVKENSETHPRGGGNHPPSSPQALPKGVDVALLQSLSRSLTAEQLVALASAAEHLGDVSNTKHDQSRVGGALLGGVLASRPLSPAEGRNSPYSAGGESSSEATKLLSGSSREMVSGLESKLSSLVSQVKEGNIPLRVAAAIGGIAMIVAGILDFIGETFSLRLISAIIQLYLILFGIATTILEVQSVKTREDWLPTIREYARFLTVVWGRGIFYVFCGTISLSLYTVLSIVTGLYVMAVGGGMIWYGERARRGLVALRNQVLDTGKLHSLFELHDKDQSGGLDVRELASLFYEMGTGLSHSEIEAAMIMIDIDQDGFVEYREFLAWWECFQDARLATVDPHITGLLS